jgi:dihydrolipoamide dehydrogenase
LILEKTPKSIAIVGAGAVGCEFADVFAAFGSQVTLIEVMPNILPSRTADSSKEVERAFTEAKIDVLTGAKISNVKVGKDSVSMSVEAGGEKKELKVDIVLVAAGRAPNIEEIGLKEQGVQLTDRGFIKISERMETSVKGLYAIGDVAGPPMLAHKGEREGVVVAEGHRRAASAPVRLHQHPRRDVLPSRSRVRRAHGTAVQGPQARIQGRQVPVHGQRPRANVR